MHKLLHFSWMFKLRKFQRLTMCKALRCMSAPNFSETGQVIAHISRFCDFSKRFPPKERYAPSWTGDINAQLVNLEQPNNTNIWDIINHNQSG